MVAVRGAFERVHRGERHIPPRTSNCHAPKGTAMSAHTPSRRHRVLRGALTVALATWMGAVLVGCSDDGQDGAGPAAGRGTAHTAAAGRLSVLAQKAADTGSLGVI